MLLNKVDDKYEYSCEDKDLQVHGWICMDPPTGFWQITPSDEFRTGGPLKQNLSSHVGPVNLAVSIHIIGHIKAFKNPTIKEVVLLATTHNSV